MSEIAKGISEWMWHLHKYCICVLLLWGIAYPSSVMVLFLLFCVCTGLVLLLF